MKLLDCALIGACAVIRANTVLEQLELVSPKKKYHNISEHSLRRALCVANVVSSTVGNMIKEK